MSHELRFSQPYDWRHGYCWGRYMYGLDMFSGSQSESMEIYGVYTRSLRTALVST